MPVLPKQDLSLGFIAQTHCFTLERIGKTWQSDRVWLSDFHRRPPVSVGNGGVEPSVIYKGSHTVNGRWEMCGNTDACMLLLECQTLVPASAPSVLGNVHIKSRNS